MIELARSIKGKMIISMGDCPEMRKNFAVLRTEEWDIVYTEGWGPNAAKDLLTSN